MGSENRDFVIERLERKLAEKEEEIETISNKLHDSIMKELREDLKNDLDINNRLVKIEQKVQELASNMSGIMDELLDQKSQIRNLGTGSSKPTPEPFKVTATQDPFKPPAPKATEGSTQTNKGNLADTLFGNKRTETAAIPEKKFTEPAVPEMKTATQGTSSGSQWSKLVDPNEVNMEIRDIGAREPVQEPPASIPAEYIVADGGDVPGNRSHSVPPEDECEYIVAEEGTPSRTLSETEYETVEDRDDEDTVVTTTRRKPL
ncbi:hypothetical protein [Methanococcoides methylutens]|uniref:Uncharacterized protein n=1 Tax=Methanococcoides methylutens MM1 TaxID=1434104 RepID=A0A0E3SSC2_METMT|nr:hypothetical protein [Methanococcoides methylutens]AKB86066.1 hypothetical protein MCMEM_2013 [Methanococcoides methylutens MM1]